MRKREKWVILFLGVAALLAGVPVARASSDYPNRPIEVVTPYAPGGGGDILITAYKDKAAKILGQPIISIFKPGAGGATGTAFVAQAKADGYTLLMGTNSPLVIAPLTKKGTGYTLDDFAPVCGLSAAPLVWCVKDDSSYKNMREFIAVAKTRKMRYATYGALTAGHIAMEALAKAAGFQAIHIPYSGSATAMSAALGGHVDIAIASGSAGMSGPGKLRVLAISHSKRIEDYKDVPTLKELGYPINVLTYFGLWAPKGMAKENIQKVYEAHKKAVAEYGKEIAVILQTAEQFILLLSPEELGVAYRDDYEFHKKMLGEMGALVK